MTPTESDADESDQGTTRRGVLRATATGLVAGGVLATLPLGSSQETVPTILLDGEVPGWVGVAPESIAGATNPTLNLTAGVRYRLVWQNVDGQPHTFAIQDASGEALPVLELVDVSPEMFGELANATDPNATVDNMTAANLTAGAAAANETMTGNETNATADGETVEQVDVTDQVAEQGAVQAVEFVATEEMATYICTIHPTTMVGDVVVDGDGMG